MAARPTQQRFVNFAFAAQLYGLPVKILSSVSTDYLIFEGRSNRTNTTLDIVYLTEATLQSVEKLSPNGIPGNVGIRAIYHEATHAYLDRKSTKAQVAAVMTTAENYYRSAQLFGGGVVTDPWRVAQEAAADYVGDRVQTFWDALDMLEGSRREAVSPNPPNDIPQRIQDIRDTYDNSMLKITFGYQAGRRGAQHHTTKPMPSTLKHFCDRELLEDKIPPTFQQSPTLDKIAADILSLL